MAHQSAHLLRRQGDPDHLSRAGARKRFLEAYAQENPELLAVLSGSVLPLYDCDHEELAVVRAECADVARALNSWAMNALLTWQGKPAEWSLKTAVATLWSWRRGSKPTRWHHPLTLFEEYPAPEPGYAAVGAGVQDSPLTIGIEVEIWDRSGGESEPDFRRRVKAACNAAIEEHIEKMKEEWTSRPAMAEMRYIDGLALWQAGGDLSKVRERLAAAGLNVGSESDLSAISHGLDRAASFIEIDRRP